MKKTTPAQNVLAISMGLLVSHLYFEWQWALYLSLAVGGTALLSGYAAKKISGLWEKLAYLLGLVMPKIMLGAVFYLFLTPLALMSRFFGKKDPLSLKNDKASTFQERNKSFEAEDFEKPW